MSWLKRGGSPGGLSLPGLGVSMKYHSGRESQVFVSLRNCPEKLFPALVFPPLGTDKPQHCGEFSNTSTGEKQGKNNKCWRKWLQGAADRRGRRQVCCQGPCQRRDGWGLTSDATGYPDQSLGSLGPHAARVSQSRLFTGLHFK